MGELADGIQWKSTMPKDLTISEFNTLKCNEQHTPGLLQITPLIADMPSVLYYANCPANLYCAFRRQFLKACTPDEAMSDKFIQYCERIISEELTFLDDFDYCYELWYNHLTASQQKQIDTVNRDNLLKREYSVFCKRELQEIEDGKFPKNRCISGPNTEHKYVMGPIVYALEHWFKRNFKGYCSGLSWQQKEALLNNRRRRGLTMKIDGDFSAWDLTQAHKLKISRIIYKKISHLVKHVTEEEFMYQVDQQFTKIKMQYITKDKYVNYGFGIVDGTVFSGSMDTTFANTMQNALIQRFVMEELLQLTKDQYDLDTAGDDFQNFMEPTVSVEKVQEAYSRIASTARTGKSGLGLTLKFLNVGPIEGSDFCSTETFFCEECDSYKIIRKLPKFLTSTPWSNTSLALSNTQKQVFFTALYDANNMWMKGLDIFTEVNDWLNYNNRNYNALTGPKKKLLMIPQQYRHMLEHDSVLDSIFKNLSSDLYYAMSGRQSEKKACCNRAWRIVLNQRYGLMDQEIDQIKANLKVDKYTDVVICPALVSAVEHRKRYQFPNPW